MEKSSDVVVRRGFVEAFREANILTHVRATDRQRDIFSSAISDAYANGALTEPEHEVRQEAVSRAETLSQLASVVSDLPAPRHSVKHVPARTKQVVQKIPYGAKAGIAALLIACQFVIVMFTVGVASGHSSTTGAALTWCSGLFMIAGFIACGILAAIKYD